MIPENAKQLEAAEEFTETICSKLATSKGVHAETAISAASSMAGTLLLRSCNLPLSGLKPGAPVFSDVINERGEKVLGIVGETLARLKVPFDIHKIRYDLPQENLPHLGLMEVQSLLDSSFRAILERHSLTEEQGAQAAAVSTANLIRQCASVLDPHVSYTIATYGLIEGCKTVPMN